MKKILTSILLALLPLVVMADPVDRDAARVKAETFFTRKSPSSARRARVQQDIRLALSNESYHVFNLGEEDGFVIISGDDCTDDILGYADSGTFDAEDMPENLRAWLQGYAEQIAWMKANNVTNESSPQGGRDNSARKVRAKIAPLLTSKWDQDDPYNRQTPLNGSQHCVTGCVATAMAQVMYYWYKKEGYEAKLENDIPDYIDKNDSYRANLKSPETFDWANMLDEYHILNEETNEEELIGTQTEHDAVAKLMKYVGYSVKMNYGLAAQGGSDAQPQNIAPALTDYFGYKSARHVGACQYSYEDLQTVIYSDLAAGRPVLYGGLSTGGGHRFVCDGYDEDDYFHFNWGWGGSSDGYYKLVLCDPKEQGIGGSTTGHTFYMEQNAVCGIHPTQTISLPIEPLECASEKDISLTDIDIPDLYRGETADITVTLKNNNETTAFNGNVMLWLDGCIGATIVNIPPNNNKECTVTATIPYIWSGTLYVYVYDIITDNKRTKIGEREVTVYGALPNLNGTAEIKDNYAEVGKALSYQLSGDVASLSASDIHPRWQVSKNGEDRWEDIAGATGTTYTPKGSDLGKHIRVIVKADGYHGELVSDVREVLNVLKGMVEFSNNSKSPGDNLACNITGEAAAIDASSIQRQWQRSSDGQSGWAYIATGPYYNLKASDVGYYFRLRVFAEGYSGNLYSPSRKCVKWECVKPVVAPMLEISTAYNQVQVTNPQVGQEYIILDYKKALYNLTESDWANAKSFNEGDNFLFMGGTAGKTNYVYTRVKETGTALAGTDVRMEAIYFGENVYVQDIQLDVARVENPNSWSNYVALEQDDLGAYYMKCGETYRITVKSLPQNATNFSGVQGSKWLVKGYSRASQWGRYYSDKECTTIIDANTYYKTVYFKPQDGMPVNYMELRAEFTKGYNDVATDAILVNVASNNGMYKVEQIYTERVSLNRGEIVVIRPFGTRPSKAVPSTVSATLTSGEGTAPIVAFIPSEKSYMVNAINATKGTFFYAVYADGTAVSTMTVDVKTHELEEMVVLPSEFTLEGTDQEGTPQGRRRSAEADGESLQLTALQFPFGADEAITWRSSNPSVATVSSDGTVTVKSGADIGETVTITATAGGYTSSSKLTVAGEKYPLYIAGIQVTSRNRYDLGAEVAKVSEASRRQYETGEMDITFNGDVLRLKNAVINTGNSNAPGIVLGKYGTTVVVEGDCSISSTSGVGMKVAKTANIVGDGSLTIISSDAAVLLDSEDGSGNDYIRLVASDLELLSLMGTNHAIKGSEGNLCSVELNNVTAWGQGNSSVISGLSGGLGLEGCYFQEPRGAEMRDGSLWDGSTLADYFYIERGEDPDGIKDLKDFRDFKDFKDSWFTIDGRKLSGKPSKAGLYIFGNRKVVIK